MVIGDMKAFREQQMGKVEKRKKEDERIRKGVYQMHAMVEAQAAETFCKEYDQTGKQTDNEKVESEKEDAKREGRKTDVKTEIEKMLSVGSRFANMNRQIV